MPLIRKLLVPSAAYVVECVNVPVPDEAVAVVVEVVAFAAFAPFSNPSLTRLPTTTVPPDANVLINPIASSENVVAVSVHVNVAQSVAVVVLLIVLISKIDNVAVLAFAVRSSR